MRYLVAFLTMAILATSGFSGVKSGEKAPAFSLMDIEGKTVQLKDFSDKVVVLEFINFSCPFVKKHYSAGHMQALQKKYSAKGVVWLQICSSASGKQGNFSDEKVKSLLEEKSVAAMHYLKDEKGLVGRSYGAKSTPHMYIIDAKGILVYQGAIDSVRSAKTTDIDKAGTINYVSQALEELLSGKSVSIKKTKSYGCSVKY